MSALTARLVVLPIVAAALALPAAAASAEPVGCQVVQILGGGLASQPNRPSTYILALTNTTGASIPAASLFTYVVRGQSFSYRSQQALLPGHQIAITLTASEPPGACDATVVPAVPTNVGIGKPPPSAKP